MIRAYSSVKALVQAMNRISTRDWRLVLSALRHYRKNVTPRSLAIFTFLPFQYCTNLANIGRSSKGLRQIKSKLLC
jgi:hypothetical protein